MKLLLLSDQHLDHQPFSAEGPDGRRWGDGADAVVLAGDINEGLQGLRWAHQAFPDKTAPIRACCGYSLGGSDGLLSDEPREVQKQPAFEVLRSPWRIEHEGEWVRATVVEVASKS
jgi:hypothetical protein